MAKVSNFIITPMSFLCGTFFPLERFPLLLQKIIGFLPLSQAVKGMRAGTEAGVIPVLALLAWLALLLPAAIAVCNRAE
jgi:ABC-type multidrug transport system permease subunit